MTRAFEDERDTLLEFVAWTLSDPTHSITLLDDNPDEARYLVNRFLANHGIPCDDWAPDTLNPDPLDRDICTTCHFRGSEHGPSRVFTETVEAALASMVEDALIERKD